MQGECLYRHKCYITLEKGYTIHMFLKNGFKTLFRLKGQSLIQKKSPRCFKSGVISEGLLLLNYKAIVPMFEVTPVVTVILVRVTGAKGNNGVTVTE